MNINRIRFIFGILFLLYVNAGARSITSLTTGEVVKKYETFTAQLRLQDIQYQNPYDPDEVDIQGIFKSPSGRIWKINGFYDNYRKANQWLIRIIPNEIGEWIYSLTVRDVNGVVKSAIYSFKVEESGLHGWIKVSENNPYYFEYDDGTSFYGVGVYYPWYIHRNGLDDLEFYNTNLFGYWNITWDSDIIESIKSGLGKYDQQSSARIDEILMWAEQRNMKMMFAIWPHDLLAGPLLENTGWNRQWQNNPYNTITSAEDFFSNEQAWKYQEKLYRYIIARFGSSRSMGIWEIVNEINGTDGGDDTPQALAWVERVHKYFKENDPYNRPTTANQKGGSYWTEGYYKVDVPTIHVYENQFDENPFPNHPLRSSYTLYHNISLYFRKYFRKPAFMGEAGFKAPDNMFGDFSSESAEYDTLYHNALWACWAGGNAATPLWWDYTSKNIITPARLKQMKIFSELTGHIDYAHIPFVLANISSGDVDAYGLTANDQAMGWIIDTNGGLLKTQDVTINGLSDSAYEIMYYNPWNGNRIGSEKNFSTNGVLTLILPKNIPTPDIAFFVKKITE